jgi:hypothetical protein
MLMKMPFEEQMLMKMPFEEQMLMKMPHLLIKNESIVLYMYINHIHRQNSSNETDSCHL